MLVTGITVNAADVGLGAVAAAGTVEVALPLLSSLCEWWWWCDSVCDGCDDIAAEDAAAGESVIEADVDGCVLPVNVEVGEEPKEAESVEGCGNAVSDCWTTPVEVEEAIKLVAGVFVIVGWRLTVAIELVSGDEDNAWLVAASGAAEEVPAPADWPTWPAFGASVVYPPIAPLKVGDSVTKTVVIPEGWLLADAVELVTTSGELEEAPAASLTDDVGGGPVAVTWTVVMMVVESWIVVTAPDWAAELVAGLPESDWLAPLAGIGKILVTAWDETDGVAACESVAEAAEDADTSGWLDEAPKDAAAAVAPATLIELDVAPAVEAEAVELSRPSKEVFPLPMPTAGTFPVSFPVPEDAVALGEDGGALVVEGVALAVDDMEGQEVSVLLEAVLGAVVAALVVAATAVCVTGVEELRRDKRDVFPPPTPTAGTLPSSVPAPVDAARRGRLKVIGSRPGSAT
jgi:hypothetical protein